MLKCLAVLFAALALVSCTTMKTSATGFLDRSTTIGNCSFPYVVYVPRNWSASRNWPVILFLHGAGERGTDGLRPTQVGLGSAIRSAPELVPAIVVFPQAPPDERWIGAPAEAAMKALREAVGEFSGDSDRVYLTGLSLGGFGVWHLALAYPDRFAALVPVCGGVVPAGTATSVQQSPLTVDASDPHAVTAQQLRDVPIWIFHGADDTVILPTESRRMVAELQLTGNAARFREYKGVGHNAWDRAYGEADLWAWLFRQKRRAK